MELRDPDRVALAYTEDSVWRNRSEFIIGRDQIRTFLAGKWDRELDYRLVKALWAFTDNRIGVRFQYEWHDDVGHWHRSYGNELWEFDERGLMRRREASINDVPILETDRKFFWSAPGPRPADHPRAYPTSSNLEPSIPVFLFGEMIMTHTTDFTAAPSPFAATAWPLGPTNSVFAQPFATVRYKTMKVGDLDIFYREAGPKDAPAVLLLHGFPTSSQMFRNLIPALADKYHVVAPDYPGYGHSSMPPHDKFQYTFDNLAKVIDEFTEKLGLTKYAIYVQDYGAPVGYRLAVKHPERITAIVVQNGNAYDEGLDNDFWKPIKEYWKEPKSKEKRDAIRNLLTYEATKWQYTDGVEEP